MENCLTSTKGVRRKQRMSFTTAQMELLENEYQKTQYPDVALKEKLAQSTGLTRQTVQVFYLWLIVTHTFVTVTRNVENHIS